MACRVVGELLAIDGTEAGIGRWGKRFRQGDALTSAAASGPK